MRQTYLLKTLAACDAQSELAKLGGNIILRGRGCPAAFFTPFDSTRISSKT